MFSYKKTRTPVERYDDLASRYDTLHQRWLRNAGGEAQAAMEAMVRALAAPDKHLLDAGCGTGNLVRTLLSEGMPSATMTLLDPSPQMLAHCADIPVPKVNGWLEALPFRDGSFDIVTCAWALETVADPGLALQELCRVVRPGGVLCLVFCADVPVQSLMHSLMRQALLYRRTGQFLSRDRVIEAIKTNGTFNIRTIPSNGPAASILAKRALPANPAVPNTRGRGCKGGKRDVTDLMLC